MKEVPFLEIFHSILIFTGLVLSSVFLEQPLTQGQEYFWHCVNFVANITNPVFCVTLLSLKALYQGVEVRSWEAREGLQLEEACRSRRLDCRWDHGDDQTMRMIRSW